MLRYFKEGNKYENVICSWVKARQGVDRLFVIMVFFCIFCHNGACLWYLQANLNSSDPTNWVVVDAIRNGEEQNLFQVQYKIFPSGLV